MVDLDIINGTIAEWENKELTFMVVERLAWLYIVRDHAVMTEGSRRDSAYLESDGGKSEFLATCRKADRERMWAVLDEMAQAVKVLQPRLYAATLKKLSES